MDIKASRRFTDNRERSFFNPSGRAAGRGGGGGPTNKVVCVYFLEGRCNRNPCRFAHTESPLPVNIPKLAKKRPGYNIPNNVWVSSGSEDRITQVQNRKKPDYTGTKNLSSASSISEKTTQDRKNPDDTGPKNSSSASSISEKTTPERICYHWLSGNCVKGDECRFLHSWFCGEGFTMLAKLEGHKKVMLVIKKHFFIVPALQFIIY